MDLKDLLKQNIEYFIDNKNERYSECDDIYNFIFDLALNFHCIDYHEDEITKVYHKVNDDDIAWLIAQDKSNFISARIFNLLIDTRKDNVLDSAKKTIAFYEASIDDSEDFEYKCSCLNKLIAISKKYKINAISFIEEKLKMLASVDRINYNAFDFHILKTAYEFNIISTDEVISKCQNKLVESAKTNGFLFDAYFELAIKVYDNLAKIKNDSLNIQSMKNDLYKLKAKIYEKIGDNDDIPMRKSHYYIIALDAYKMSKINMLKDEVCAIRTKLDYNQKKSLSNMQNISESFDLSKTVEGIRKRIDQLSEEKLIYQLLYFGGIQNKEEQIKSVKNHFQEFTLSALFPTSIVNYDGKTVSKLRGINLGGNDVENDEIIVEHAYDSIRLNSQILGQIISMIINIIKEKGFNLEENIKKIVNDSYIIKDSRKKIVTKGLLYGYNYDFESSLSILVPQFENAVRELAYICGDTKYKLNSDATESVNGLDYYFKNGSVLSNVLDENIFFTINSVFVNEHGLNFRNNFAHGCIESFDNYSSIYVWWLILYVIAVYS